ncbi:MAG: 4Fe-4S binding protein [Methanocellales archaeon]|nr:4Fe-4S binding protein [Methanocellales archaeon]
MISLRAVINENLCIGCGACSQVCPQGAIMMRPRKIRQTPTLERVWTLENKIRTLGERLEGIKDTIEEIKKR